MRKLIVAGLCLAAFASGEDQFGAEFRKERGDFGSSCTAIQKFIGCAETLFTGTPFHLSVGSLAPGNGIGFGLAVVDHWSTTNWRNSWSLDSVASPNGSWRAGAYLSFVRSKLLKSTQAGITVDNQGAAAAAPDAGTVLAEQPVVRLYSEVTSLNQVGYFGIGPATSDTARSYFGFREIVTGGTAVFPVKQARWMNMALLGEANARVPDVRQSFGLASPTIGVLYIPATAPGLASQPAFAQFGEGVRIRPGVGNLRLNYTVQLQQFAAPGNSTNSFQRFTVDLNHQFALYKSTRTLLALDSNGPNDCSTDLTDSDHKCPPVKFPTAGSRNLDGSIGVRLLIQDSIVPDGHTVPFYFQPTLGGTDIEGISALASYQDFRFRAPNTILLRTSFEHSIWGPFGAIILLDEGKVGLQPGDLGFTHLAHSYSAGLTLRGGGFPIVHLLFSWGGHEGSRTTSGIDTSLLGGTARPSLY